MLVTWRPLAVWPYAPRPAQPDRFKATLSRSLGDLERELGAVNATDVVIGIVCNPALIRLDGQPKGGPSSLRADKGVEISFDAHGQRLVFHTDAFPTWWTNLRAIALGLEALRTIERYGITSSDEQYAGFAQITAGGPDPERGRKLVDRFGSIRRAQAATHPDTREDGMTDRDFADVQAYREIAEVATR